MGNQNTPSSGFYEKRMILNKYQFTIFNGNTSYLILARRKEMKIFILESNDKTPIIIQKETNISLIEMHPRLKTIFLSVLNDKIIIWEIKGLTKECIEKILIKGHTKNITKAVFCKTNDKLLASFSDDKTIKIWHFERHFCIANIQTVLDSYNIKLYYEYIYYQNENESITIYNINELKEVKTIKIEVDNFIIKDSNTIIIQFKKKLTSYSKTQIKSFYLFDLIVNMFYDNQLQILYLLFNEIMLILEPIKMKVIIKYDFARFHLVFIDNIINSKYIFGNFLIFNNSSFYICSFYSKNIYDENKITELSFPKNDFWKGSVSSISDIDALNLEENENFLDIEILKKDYLNDEEFEKELTSNYKIQLKDKKNQVKNIIKNHVEKKNEIEKNYFEYLKLLIKDNTNTELLIKYLHFLEKNNKNIKYKYFEDFQKEYNYYIIAFTNEELLKNNFKGNKISERELFFDLLKRIISLDIKKEKNSFHEEIETKLKTTQIFNQPIDFNNEELYWYRNRIIIYFSLKKIFSKDNMAKFLLMKNCIIKIFKRKLLDINNTYILKDKELLTSLIIFIAIPQDDLYCDFNLNLIESKNNNKERNEELIKRHFKYNNGHYELLESKNSNNNFILVEDIKTICLDNFILNLNTDINLTKEELKNYDELKNYFYNFLDVSKINKFLSKIYCSRVFREAFVFLYPDYYKFPFHNEEEALKFINDNAHYVPFKIMTSGAVTDKFTLEMYYIFKTREYFININISLINKYKNLIIKILYSSSFVKTNYHEINHEFYNIFFFHSNGNIPIETPRKKNSDEREGGKNLKRLLFNNTLRSLTLAQSLYILNERNYNKSLEEFRKGFNETKIEDLIVDIDGIFSEFSELNDFLKKPNSVNIIKNIIIAGDNEDNDESFINNCFIDAEDENDVLGFIRN